MNVCLTEPMPVLRYAMEAMHLSEEVRLLKAELRAANDKTYAKLQQVTALPP